MYQSALFQHVPFITIDLGKTRKGQELEALKILIRRENNMTLHLPKRSMMPFNLSTETPTYSPRIDPNRADKR